MAEAQTDPALEAVMKQLRAVARKRFAKEGLQDQHGWGCEGVEDLATVVRALHPAEVSPQRALLLTLQDGLRHVGLQTVDSTPVTYERAITLLWGVDPGGWTAFARPDSGHGYTAQTDALGAEAGLLETQKNKREAVTRHVRERLAKVLLALANDGDRELTDDRVDEAAPQVTTAPWIGRRAELDEAARLLRSAKRLPLVLWGESGNGKTRLAERLAEQHFATGTVVRIRGPVDRDAPFFDDDIFRALKQLGEKCESWSRQACLDRFRELLVTPGSFDLVILDDLGEGDAEKLWTSAPLVQVITTQQYKPRSRAVFLIRVSAFLPNDALRFCTHRLPNEDDGLLQTLCEALGYRPLALDLACRVVADGTDLVELLRSFEISLSTTLTAAAELIATDLPGSLIRVYQRIVQLLADEPLTLKLLRVIAWWSEANKRLVIVEALRAYAPQRPTEFLIEASLRSLERFGLVELTDDAVQMNALTIDLLRVCTRDTEVEHLHRAMFETFVSVPRMLAKQLADGATTEANIDDYLRHDRNGERSAFASFLQMAAFATARSLETISVGAGQRVGCLILSTGTWFLWQQNFDFFEPASSDLAFCICSLKLSGIALWGTGVFGASPYRTARILGLLMVTLRDATNSYARSMYGDNGSPLLTSTSDNSFVIVPQLDETRFHHQLLPHPIPPNVRQSLGVATWSRCGQRRVWPDGSSTTAEKPSCPQCFDLQAQAVPASTVFGLESSADLSEALGLTAWAFGFETYLALSVIAEHPESYVEHALQFAEQGLRTAEKEYALRACRGALVYLRQLCERRGDSDAVSELPRRIEGLPNIES